MNPRSCVIRIGILGAVTEGSDPFFLLALKIIDIMDQSLLKTYNGD
jgi:hypothetical protein